MKNTVVLQHIVVGGFFFVLYVKQRLQLMVSPLMRGSLFCHVGMVQVHCLPMPCAFILSSLGNSRCMKVVMVMCL